MLGARLRHQHLSSRALHPLEIAQEALQIAEVPQNVLVVRFAKLKRVNVSFARHIVILHVAVEHPVHVPHSEVAHVLHEHHLDPVECFIVALESLEEERLKREGFCKNVTRQKL